MCLAFHAYSASSFAHRHRCCCRTANAAVHLFFAQLPPPLPPLHLFDYLQLKLSTREVTAAAESGFVQPNHRALCTTYSLCLRTVARWAAAAAANKTDLPILRLGLYHRWHFSPAAFLGSLLLLLRHVAHLLSFFLSLTKVRFPSFFLSPFSSLPPL